MIEELEGFYFACNISDLTDKVGKRFYLNDVDVAVFKVKENIYAVSNICPHQQAHNIYEGFIEDDCVICPLHGWMFKLENGNLTGGSRGLDSYEVKIVTDKIYVKAIEKKLNW